MQEERAYYNSSDRTPNGKSMCMGQMKNKVIKLKVKSIQTYIRAHTIYNVEVIF